MSNLSFYRSIQSSNKTNSKICLSSLKLKSLNSNDELLKNNRIPCQLIQSKPLLSSVDPIIKSSRLITKRCSSTILFNNLLPRRKSLQTTAIATRRQSLWMSIAKNDSSPNDFQISLLPLKQQENNLIRKKILRLLLVFSYLLSISLLAVALATFYGFFWSGYSTTKSSTILDISSTVSLISNSTFNYYQSDIEKCKFKI